MSGVPSERPPLPEFSVLAARGCESHPARACVAVCRQCLAPCCAECVTRYEDVNLCARCLGRVRETIADVPGAKHVRAALAGESRAGILLGTPARVLAALAAYGFVALLAASWGIALPFFDNERRLEANKDRVTEVQLAVSSYFDDVGKYPSPDRGLSALLRADDSDRDAWRGPYTTAEPSGGKPAPAAAGNDEVVDVFGRPLFYYAKPDPSVDDGTMSVVYIASPGANGTWDTPGVESGNPPHEALGDDVLRWVVWP